jgi:uncharacterized OsmC-like protein
MSERRFRLRLACRYSRPDNTIAELAVEICEDGDWKPFELTLLSPGFQMFLSAAFSCQHLYFRTNCAERGLVLDSADGELEAVTGPDWVIQRMHVRFAGRLLSGDPTQGAIDYIVERMGHCPVSANLKPIAERETRVELTS